MENTSNQSSSENEAFFKLTDHGPDLNAVKSYLIEERPEKVIIDASELLPESFDWETYISILTYRYLKFVQLVVVAQGKLYDALLEYSDNVMGAPNPIRPGDSV